MKGKDVRILSISGSLCTWKGVKEYFFNDASSCLLINGEVVRAIEQERLDRIKHSCCTPVDAVRWCLDGVSSVNELDAICYPFSEEMMHETACMHDVATPMPSYFYFTSFKHIIADAFEHGGLGRPPLEKIFFVDHHESHAAAALFHSGFQPTDTLVVVVDGRGDNDSMSIFDGSFRKLRSFGVEHSLGFLYEMGCRVLGFQLFDEYKVMGLAPYGNTDTFREDMSKFYCLLPDGDYIIRNHEHFISFWTKKIGKVKEGDDISQIGKDFAAALQELLEIVLLHVLKYFSQSKMFKYVCLAGGVAHNCSFNGALYKSGLFDKVWVHPAAHDAGAGVGAALLTYFRKFNSVPSPLKNVFWGTNIISSDFTQELRTWSSALTVAQCTPSMVASWINEGKVVGWVDGRSEFGPRALGNRSILADPRPAQNKSRINGAVKKRESFRPFAPAVLVEEASNWFDVPDRADLPFMTFVVKVREEKRKHLGAVTHVDGTARIQTVNRQDLGQFWELINCFFELTGVPVLLNTSFNNHAEPIVNSLSDAINCFLTTEIDMLIVGGTLAVTKLCQTSAFPLDRFDVSLSRFAQVIFPQLHQSHNFNTPTIVHHTYGPYIFCGDNDRKVDVPISIGTAFAENRRIQFNNLVSKSGLSSDVVYNLVHKLWSERLCKVEPTE